MKNLIGNFKLLLSIEYSSTCVRRRKLNNSKEISEVALDLKLGLLILKCCDKKDNKCDSVIELLSVDGEVKGSAHFVRISTIVATDVNKITS